MKKYVLNIERLYSGQTANALVLSQVDEDFPVLLPSVPEDVEDLSMWIEKCRKIHPSFALSVTGMTREQLNEYIIDFNLELQTKFKEKGHRELYMVDDTNTLKPNRRTLGIGKKYLHCINGHDESGMNVSQMGVLFPYRKMSSKSLYSSYLQMRKPSEMDDLLEMARGITFQGKTTYQECLQGVSQVGNELYIMSPNVQVESGTIYGNNMTVMNGHGIPRSFSPTMTLFQPSRTQYDMDNIQKDMGDGMTGFIEWYRQNNHKTRISLNKVYGTNVTTIESLGPSSYSIDLPTYGPDYILFMNGENASSDDEWMGLNSVTFRNIRAGNQHLDFYQDGKYIIDNERKGSEFPNVGLMMNLYDTFITEHDKILRIKVQKDSDYNRFVLKFDWQVLVADGLLGTLDVVMKVGFTDGEKTRIFETTFSESTKARTYAMELPNSALHSHEVDIVVMMRHDVDFGKRNSEREYGNRLKRSGFLISNFRLEHDETERKDNLTFGDYVNEIGIDSSERMLRNDEFWRVSQYKKDLAYQTVVETSLRNLTSSGISYPNNYSSGDLYGDMFVTKSVLDPRYDMNISVENGKGNILLSEGRDYIGLGSCSNQLSLLYKPTQIHIERAKDGKVVTERTNPETPLNYQMVEVVKNINRFESSIKHKSNVFSVVVENSNLAEDTSVAADETLEKYKKQLRDSVTQFVRNTCEGIVPVHTQLFDVQFT